MSELKIVVCDGKGCKKEIRGDNSMQKCGWLCIWGFTKYNGISRDGGILVPININGIFKHFCSWKCLQAGVK